MISVFEVASKRVTRRIPLNDLTDILNVTWSPDGKRIAFSTDRFTSDLEALAFGELRLALISLDGGGIEPVAGFSSGKHLGSAVVARRMGLVFSLGP